jgi:signal transduction histidine kinase
LLLFKYADPRQRHRTPGAVAQTSATIAVEVWQDQGLSLPVEAVGSTDGVRSFAASDCGLCQPLLLGLPEVMPGNTALAQPANPLFQLASLPAYLLLPLESQGMVLGTIVLQQEQARRWLEDEVEFVRLIATQLSNAIIQTRSFQQVQSVVQERTAQLRRSLEVQAKLYEKTRQQVEQLRRLNEEREEFLSTISHELLTPLTSMVLAIRMLRQGELDDQRRSKYLDILEQQCTQETHLINDMLALRKLEMNTATTHLQKLDLHQMIQDVIGAIDSRWREKDLRLNLNLPPQLSLYSDRDSFHRILLELLTNAKKYSEPSSTIDLTAYQEGELVHRQTILTIRNIGAGIAPDELPHIFEKFRRGRGVTQQAIQGTGLGLALVKSLVEHLEGTITVMSAPIENDCWETCFTVRLPQVLEHCIQGIHATA